MRLGTGLWAPLFPNLETRISAGEGSMAANGMGAVKYLECSARSGEGVNRIFEEGARIVLRDRLADEEAAQIRNKHEKSPKRSSRTFMCFY
ncbi:hypothetical protein GGS23DRAFT_559189 [Durotheca rogersii]|uniref:uncharacterized protein n=1 Tax=Durotheca rogersii TaxID=419775 RepID=UPI002220A231|nr:uncharacterized protein GGS23DRAFT_559189 [Durotheca rogersii]KAI5865426.1 hypothetical protein GGS23DRAFT_559189 [Durotheca rogersii]